MHPLKDESLPMTTFISRSQSRWAMALLTMMLWGTASAQMAEGFSALRDNRPWAALHALQAPGGEAQVAAQVAVFVGDDRPGCAILSGRPPEQANGAEYRDALATIAEAASDARVVMLNEYHASRVPRLFLSELIERLDAMGFDALAAETFYPRVADTLRDGIPKTSTGHYTADPAFAAAVRVAARAGWDFVAYESMGGGREARERGQAAALADWLTRHPKRRLLVYAGGSHISEDPEAGWMAARLTALTGIDPLTIAQTAACAQTADAWQFDAPGAVVAWREGRAVSQPHVDLLALHPPQAVASAHVRRGVPVQVCLAPWTDASLLRAFAVGDPADAIAIDQAVVSPDARQGDLRLPPGRYRLAREDLRALHPLGSLEVVVGESTVAACRHPDGTG